MKNKTIKELREICKEAKIKGYSKLKKADLIELIEKHFNINSNEIVNKNLEAERVEKEIIKAVKDVEVINYKNKDEWIETRKLGIGGSDIAGILGESKYKTPIDIFFDKKQGTDFTGNRFTYWGNKLEPLIAEEFKEKHKEYKVIDFKKTFKKSYSLANTDRILFNENKGYGVLEIKTTNAFNKKEWEEETVPQEYYCQVMHYLAVTGFNYAYLVCLIGGNDYKEFYIERVEEECEMLLNASDDFWNDYIIKDIIPPADGSQKYSEYQKEKAKNLENKIEIEIENLDSIIQEYKEKQSLIKEIEKECELLKQNILNEMIEKNGTVSKCENGKASLVFTKRASLDKKSFEEKYNQLISDYKKAEEEFKIINESVSLRIS